MTKINTFIVGMLVAVVAFAGATQFVRAEDAPTGTKNSITTESNKAQTQALREQRIKQLEACRANSKAARETFTNSVRLNEKAYNAAVKAARATLAADLKAAGALPEGQRAAASKSAREKFQASVKTAKAAKQKANAEALKIKNAAILAAHKPCVVSQIHVPGYPSVLGDFTDRFQRPAGGAETAPLPDGFVKRLEQREATESQEHQNEQARLDRKAQIDAQKQQQQANREKKISAAQALKECKKTAENAFKTASKTAQTTYEAAMKPARETLKTELAAAGDDATAKQAAQDKFVAARKAALDARKTAMKTALDAKKAALKVCLDTAKATTTTNTTTTTTGTTNSAQ